MSSRTLPENEQRALKRLIAGGSMLSIARELFGEIAPDEVDAALELAAQWADDPFGSPLVRRQSAA